MTDDPERKVWLGGRAYRGGCLVSWAYVGRADASLACAFDAVAGDGLGVVFRLHAGRRSVWYEYVVGPRQ